jgi:beta-mannanase
LRRLATPVYLRIGYEFNGLTWNGYQPVPYQQAFIRITNALRAANLEVATVWDMEIPDGVSTYFDYYPGDQYVDWFGINIFQAKAFQDSTLSGVFAQARARKKPVMMGEETGFTSARRTAPPVGTAGTRSSSASCNPTPR